MQQETTYDVIITGSGAAGLHAALSLDSHLRILILSKNDLDLSNSALAQGGVAAVLNRAEDSEALHFRDTLVAGGNTNDPEAVSVLVQNGPRDVLHLIDYGVDFDRAPDGALDLTLEGGHSRRRIAHHRDTTGYEIVTKLIAEVKTRENIEIAAHTALLRLERAEGGGFCAGILSKGELLTLRARFFILATGGIGRVFKYTTNSAIATGDGIMMARHLGAQIKNLSLVQFHPTAFAGNSDQQRFLISESVRGEGAVLLNCHGERFMKSYDARGELAPRDVVSKAIRDESLKTGSDRFYLDITGEDPDFIKKRFPEIYRKCLADGVDMTKDKIPVYPCQHYLMGGIDVDTLARTTVPGLYAVGECSHTGVHGQNRLASNSLLEAFVFSKRAAEDIMGRPFPDPSPCRPFALPAGIPVPPEPAAEIREIMQRCFFILPDPAQIACDLPRVAEIRRLLETGGFADGPALLEARSEAEVAEIILTELQCRK